MLANQHIDQNLRLNEYPEKTYLYYIYIMIQTIFYDTEIIDAHFVR